VFAPTCLDCRTVMKKVKTGISIIVVKQGCGLEYVPDDVLYLLRGDIYECPMCGHKVISDYGSKINPDIEAITNAMKGEYVVAEIE